MTPKPAGKHRLFVPFRSSTQFKGFSWSSHRKLKRKLADVPSDCQPDTSEVKTPSDEIAESVELTAEPVVPTTKPELSNRYCITCTKEFCSKSSLRRHMNNIHPNLLPRHTCKRCQESFIELQLLQEHYKDVHEIDVLLCSRRKRVKRS